MRLLWLPDVLRDAGLNVRTYPGWQTRGADSWGPLRGQICHATAGSRTSTDAGETRTLWETGSTSAPVPISQLYLSRSGTWWVGASGRCNHVLVGDKGPHRGWGNSVLLGIEAQNDNRGEPWSAAQLDSYQRGCAAICRQMGWPAGVTVGHHEHQNGKSDPLGIDMAAFRRAVADLIEGDDDMATPEENAKALLDARVKSRVTGKDVKVGDSILAGTHAYAHRLHEVVPSQLAAILAAVAGDDAVEAMRAELERAAEAERAERAAELAPLHAALEVAAAERAELRVLIGQVQSGEISAAAVVDMLADRLGRD
jgi:hypothetical protein